MPSSPLPSPALPSLPFLPSPSLPSPLCPPSAPLPLALSCPPSSPMHVFEIIGASLFLSFLWSADLCGWAHFDLMAAADRCRSLAAGHRSLMAAADRSRSPSTIRRERMAITLHAAKEIAEGFFREHMTAHLVHPEFVDQLATLGVRDFADLAVLTDREFGNLCHRLPKVTEEILLQLCKEPQNVNNKYWGPGHLNTLHLARQASQDHFLWVNKGEQRKYLKKFGYNRFVRDLAVALPDWKRISNSCFPGLWQMSRKPIWDPEGADWPLNSFWTLEVLHNPPPLLAKRALAAAPAGS